MASSSNGHNPPVTVAVDAMGGDHGPSEIVLGAQIAAKRGVRVVLVGRRESIEAVLEPDADIKVVEAPDVIAMHETPTIINKRPDSSLAKAIGLVTNGEADAAISAGNSGAIMAGALLAWGRQSGVMRPAYGGEVPTRNGHTFILDIGANAEVKPVYLLQFAVMGAAYMQVVHGVRHPRIGLLNNGTEDGKGTTLTREANELLQRRTELNYIGSIEANQVFESAADIVVTDGFTGNILLKTAEGVAEEIFNLIRGELSRDPLSKLGGTLGRPAFRRIKRRLDYEEYGGAPLLGVNGVMINAHGRSRAKAIANAIGVGERMAQRHLLHHIGEELHDTNGDDARRGTRVMRKLHLARLQKSGKPDDEDA
ncbi:MAG TPA: phosphate acyltransferase PlsX [Chloroflexota bacterium]|jgi:glycerol-3-phosphate acyltransferase PlsX|nr:phosphate acyltransferase PlsX [Chloroflexota bacterium]